MDKHLSEWTSPLPLTEFNNLWTSDWSRSKVFDPGQVGSIFVARGGAGQPSLVCIWIWKIFLRPRSKSTQVKDRLVSYLLRVKKYPRVRSGPISTLNPFSSPLNWLPDCNYTLSCMSNNDHLCLWNQTGGIWRTLFFGGWTFPFIHNYFIQI